MNPQLSISIADIPFGISLEEYFILASDLDVGVEIVLGYKTRLNKQQLHAFAKKYKVKICSLHQPPWSFYGLFFDEDVFKLASEFGSKINFHPQVATDLTSSRGKNYLARIEECSKKYSVPIMLENMPHVKKYIPIISPFINSIHPSGADFTILSTICKDYGFGSTFDTDHLRNRRPQESEEYKKIEKYLVNIHLSSFSTKHEHLSLDQGDLDSDSYLTYLREKKYHELITLELSPHYYVPKKKYFSDITTSISIVRKYL